MFPNITRRLSPKVTHSNKLARHFKEENDHSDPLSQILPKTGPYFAQFTLNAAFIASFDRKSGRWVMTELNGFTQKLPVHGMFGILDGRCCRKILPALELARPHKRD